MHVSLIIIFINDVEEIKKYIDLIVQEIPVYQRPECLITLYDQNRDFSEDIERVLKLAWTNKILDFTMINVNSGKIMISYNPFDSTVEKKSFNDKVQIFPDKLKSIKNYPLNVAFCTNDLFKKAKIRPEFAEFNVKIDYTVRYMLAAMNFDLRPVDGE